MGASYSFVGCLLLGGATGSSGSSPLTAWMDSRPFFDRMKVLGVIAVSGILLFGFFYKGCSFSLDACGNYGFVNFGTVLLGCIAGLVLGFGVGGIVSSIRRRGTNGDPDIQGLQFHDANYNPLQMGGGNPSISMV